MRLINLLPHLLIAVALAGCQRAEDSAAPQPATIDERRALEDAAEMIGTRPVASPTPDATGAAAESTPPPTG